MMGYEVMTVLSGSMEPAIHTGSVIAIKPVDDPKHYKVGDVITFKAPDDKQKLITHRIKEVKPKGDLVEYITKGDANKTADLEPVPAGNIVGQYANFTVPYVGYMLSFAKSKAGLIWLMIVPGALLVVWQLGSLFLAVARLEKEKTAAKATSGQEPTRNV